MERALIMKTLRGSFQERRTYIEKKHTGNIKELIAKVPILGKAEFVSILVCDLPLLTLITK
jgi:hypothetical protein